MPDKDDHQMNSVMNFLANLSPFQQKVLGLTVVAFSVGSIIFAWAYHPPGNLTLHWLLPTGIIILGLADVLLLGNARGIVLSVSGSIVLILFALTMSPNVLN